MSEEEDVPLSNETKIHPFLLFSYIAIFIWGVWAFYVYWNGSQGWADRGYWKKLQEAAHTTYPFEKKIPALEEKRVLKIEADYDPRHKAS